MRIGKIALVALVAFATPAMAERTGFFVGGDIGQSNWNLDKQDANNLSANLADQVNFYNPNINVTSTSNNFSDTSTTYSFFVGYQIWHWFAVEAGWMDLGSTSVQTNATYTYSVVNPIFPPPPTGGSYRARSQFESTGWALSALPMLPIGDAWNLYGRLGYYMGDNKLTGRFQGQDTRAGVAVGSPYDAKINESDSSGVFLWGLGASYTFDERVSLRLEYDNIADVAEVGSNKSDVQRFTLGLVYRFGHVEEAVPVVAAAPVAVAAAEPAKCSDQDGDGVCDADDKCPNTPAGTTVDKVGCPCSQELKVLFDFDKSELRPESITELERVVKFMNDVPFATAKVDGHTDSVGSEAYNLALSDRRAKAVFDYLTSRGVDPSRLKSQGFGESNPIAPNDTAEGRQLNRRVMLNRTDSCPN